MGSFSPEKLIEAATVAFGQADVRGDELAF
jgi:hypothetical protein